MTYFLSNPETDTNHFYYYNEEENIVTERVTVADVFGNETVIEEKKYTPTECQLLAFEWCESGKLHTN